MIAVRHCFPALACALCALLPSHAFAAAGDAVAQPLFNELETLEARIEVPLGTVMRQRDEEDYHEGTFTWFDADGTPQVLDLKVRARGRYRRQSDVCRFAPLRLNFRKKQVEGTPFDGQDKLKLVTHCQSRGSRYEQYLLKEYLSYRVLQTLTDDSFRARLLRVQWVDTDDPEDVIERYAFLIEDDDLMAERLGTAVAEVTHAAPDELDPGQSALVSVFQYLIANTDYSLLAGPAGEECCHNAVLLVRKPAGYLPVPYDFDFSGLVDTPYAEPNPKLRIRSVRSRLYRGHCAVNAELPGAIERFRARRADIRALFETQEGLEERTRERALDFIDDFYEVIDSPENVERELVRACL